MSIKIKLIQFMMNTYNQRFFFKLLFGCIEEKEEGASNTMQEFKDYDKPGDMNSYILDLMCVSNCELRVHT